MNIDHIAIWVDDLEKMRHFYLTYFDVVSGEKYTNVQKGAHTGRSGCIAPAKRAFS